MWWGHVANQDPPRCMEGVQRVHGQLWWGHLANQKHPKMHRGCAEGCGGDI